MNNNVSKNNNSQTGDDQKLGLALSGGGFRASFFHIGVLAAMAELGLLRHVEVISTVSGGSIIGALYYLHLKKLYESQPDNKVDDKDYVRLVKDIENNFFDAVKQNIRMKVFSNPFKNLRMSFANYSRSDRIGELYDKILYQKVLDKNNNKPVEMRNLKIIPPDNKDFHPRKDNDKRKAKIPILLINSTTLNTGHNWRFEASTMGEKLRSGNPICDIDKNCILERSESYDKCIEKQQDVKLGEAVAASACVPGIFHPLAISKLYPDIRVQLVDGGVHDNQGIQGLIDENCTIYVISDASGQMDDDTDPHTGIAQVISRTNSILMDRVREEQILRLYDKYEDPTKAPIALMHLTKGITAEKKPYFNKDGKTTYREYENNSVLKRCDDFGVAEKNQRALAHIRTDLDSFTEIEAYSLMLDGYLISKCIIPETTELQKMISKNKELENKNWKFFEVLDYINKTDHKLYKKHLNVASKTLFKVLLLGDPIAWLLTILPFVIIGWLVILYWSSLNAFFSFSFSVGQLFIVLLIFCIGLIPRLKQRYKIYKWILFPIDFVNRLIFRGILPALLSVAVIINLCFINPLFIGKGQVKNLKD